MAGYLGAIPVPQATQHRESFTATSGQTTFNTAGYTVGFLDVYLNGSHLSPADFTATNGSDVVLASGASADDVCDIISYTAFEVNAQTFTGTTTLTGNLLLGDNDKAIFGAGSDLQIYHDGSNSYITDAGTGNTIIETNGSQISLVGGGEYMVRAQKDGATRLYYDGSQKIATTSTGIDVTGNVIATGTVEPAGDTAAGDNAAIGYTAAEGLILTGQGSTNDVTIKNDADADVLEIPTGTTNVNVAGNLGVGGTVDGRDVATDGSKLDGIESGATADQTAAQLLTAIKTVDGAGSGLDADTLDGLSEATFMRRSANSQLDMNNNDIVGVDQIFHEGDSNTYIQFHASDQFRVVTGGSERLEVNNSRTQIDNLLVTGTTTLSGTVTGAVSTTAGAVGTYAFASWPSPGSAKVSGATVAGSTLRLAALSAAGNNTTAYGGITGTSLSGTWQLMGGWTGNSNNQVSVFVRIS